MSLRGYVSLSRLFWSLVIVVVLLAVVQVLVGAGGRTSASNRPAVGDAETITDDTRDTAAKSVDPGGRP